jgi:hypothetical protein
MICATSVGLCAPRSAHRFGVNAGGFFTFGHNLVVGVIYCPLGAAVLQHPLPHLRTGRSVEISICLTVDAEPYAGHQRALRHVSIVTTPPRINGGWGECDPVPGHTAMRR